VFLYEYVHSHYCRRKKEKNGLVSFVECNYSSRAKTKSLLQKREKFAAAKGSMEESAV